MPFRLHLLCALLAAALAPGVARSDLPAHVMVGYWHNWMNTPNHQRLVNVSTDWDVVNVAFAVPTTWGGTTMGFQPDPGLYPDPAVFTQDVAALHARGQKVVLSFGGATAPVQLLSEADIDAFVTSLHGIITTYGFAGLDIDLEGTSLGLAAGDTDFRAPTTPSIVNMIGAIERLLDLLPGDFILSAAPETIYVQAGIQAYGGPWGAYLPVLHALRDRLSWVQVQHYNSGSMYGLDGAIYVAGTADFHVAMAEMLLQGFAVAGGAEFPPLQPRQVVIGVPASPGAAGSGYTEPDTLVAALDRLATGAPYGGAYELVQPGGYPGLRGVMMWSINWDVEAGGALSGPVRSFLSSLDGPADAPPLRTGLHLEQNHPNPFNPATVIAYELDRAGPVRLEVHDLRGRRVGLLVDAVQPAGRHEVTFRAAHLASGVYVCRLRAAGREETRPMALVR
jgi:chitinase